MTKIKTYDSNNAWICNVYVNEATNYLVRSGENEMKPWSILRGIVGDRSKHSGTNVCVNIAMAKYEGLSSTTGNSNHFPMHFSMLPCIFTNSLLLLLLPQPIIITLENQKRKLEKQANPRVSHRIDGNNVIVTLSDISIGGHIHKRSNANIQITNLSALWLLSYK